MTTSIVIQPRLCTRLHAPIDSSRCRTSRKSACHDGFATRFVSCTSRRGRCGAAETPRWAAAAKAEMANNPRYVWRGDRPRAEVRRLLGRARAMVLSSLSEGGANVISEAAAAGVPVLATRIDGSVGLLGRDYPGYFPVGDTQALAQLLTRIETDAAFLERVHRAIARRAHLFRPALEKAAWRKLIDEVMPKSPSPRGRDRANARVRNSRAGTDLTNM